MNRAPLLCCYWRVSRNRIIQYLVKCFAATGGIQRRAAGHFTSLNRLKAACFFMWNMRDFDKMSLNLCKWEMSSNKSVMLTDFLACCACYWLLDLRCNFNRILLFFMSWLRVYYWIDIPPSSRIGVLCHQSTGRLRYQWQYPSQVQVLWQFIVGHLGRIGSTRVSNSRRRLHNYDAVCAL
jgi:hypothetical protein